MRITSLLVLLILLPACSGSLRARTPAEWVGFGSQSSWESTLKEGIETDDCTELQLQRLRNEFLKKELEACKEKPPEPVETQPEDTIEVPVEVELKAIKLKIVPADESGDLGAAPLGTFPAAAPVEIATAVRACCPPVPV